MNGQLSVEVTAEALTVRIGGRVHKVDQRREMPPTTGWRADAACRGLDVNWWFPTRGDTVSQSVWRLVCAQCPVIDECDMDAFAQGRTDDVGCRAGRSGKQRRRVPLSLRTRRCEQCRQPFTGVGVMRAAAVCSDQCATERRRDQQRRPTRSALPDASIRRWEAS